MKIKYNITVILIVFSGLIVSAQQLETDDCNNCQSFKPQLGEYVISAWVKEQHPQQVESYTNTAVVVNLRNESTLLTSTVFKPSGAIIDGWQQVFGTFSIDNLATHLDIELVNDNSISVGPEPIDFDPYFNPVPQPVNIGVKQGFWVKFLSDLSNCEDRLTLEGNIAVDVQYDLQPDKIYQIQATPEGRPFYIQVVNEDVVNLDRSYTVLKQTDFSCSDFALLAEESTSQDPVIAYFDDVRIHPFNGNMKSFVYDPYTQRLMAELDENNYATFYEYDQEGGLVRVKKETEKGVYTIQETRSSSTKTN